MPTISPADTEDGFGLLRFEFSAVSFSKIVPSYRFSFQALSTARSRAVRNRVLFTLPLIRIYLQKSGSVKFLENFHLQTHRRRQVVNVTGTIEEHGKTAGKGISPLPSPPSCRQRRTIGTTADATVIRGFAGKSPVRPEISDLRRLHREPFTRRGGRDEFSERRGRRDQKCRESKNQLIPAGVVS